MAKKKKSTGRKRTYRRRVSGMGNIGDTLQNVVVMGAGAFGAGYIGQQIKTRMANIDPRLVDAGLMLAGVLAASKMKPGMGRSAVIGVAIGATNALAQQFAVGSTGNARVIEMSPVATRSTPMLLSGYSDVHSVGANPQFSDVQNIGTMMAGSGLF